MNFEHIKDYIIVFECNKKCKKNHQFMFLFDSLYYPDLGRGNKEFCLI